MCSAISVAPWVPESGGAHADHAAGLGVLLVEATATATATMIAPIASPTSTPVAVRKRWAWGEGCGFSARRRRAGHRLRQRAGGRFVARVDDVRRLAHTLGHVSGFIRSSSGRSRSTLSSSRPTSSPCSSLRSTSTSAILSIPSRLAAISAYAVT